MLIAVGQVNPVVGDVEGNAALLCRSIADARAAGAHLVLLPELAVSGPAATEMLRPDFLERCRISARRVAGESERIVALFGAPLRHGGEVHNGLIVATEGRTEAVYEQADLGPSGPSAHRRPAPLIAVGDDLIGLTLGADLWMSGGPADVAAGAGAALILHATASPFAIGDARRRSAALRERATALGCPIASCNLWGGDDAVVFDGGSSVVDHRGQVLVRAGQFGDELLLCEIDLAPTDRVRSRGAGQRPAAGRPEPAARIPAPARAPAPAPAHRRARVLAPELELWEALVCGIAARADQPGFECAAVALDGDVGSALVAALAVDAVGSECVRAVVPSDPWAGRAAEAVARSAAVALGLEPADLDLDLDSDGPQSAPRAGRFGASAPPDAGRAQRLAGLAEAQGWLLLTSADKSQLACGIGVPGTLAPLGDLWHTTVERLADWRRGRGTVPFLDRLPRAWEQAGLPPFSVADPVLEAYVEAGLDPAAIVARGHEEAVVRRLVALVEAAEPARRRTAPALEVSARPFRRDRRMTPHRRFARAAADGQAAASSSGSAVLSSGRSSSA
jgi:predicted amidohydrolase/NH3-dependent NAD+ synthetase